MKLGLGTVQFGLDYGISNREGQTRRDEAGRILDLAAASGIRVLDTAALYGESEQVLGELLPDGHGFHLVTKSRTFLTPRISAADAELLAATFRRSLERLRQESVYGVLLHSAADLLADGGGRLFDALLALKRAGLVAKIGVSTYTPEQVERILERFPIDLIQVPVNVLDQRLVRRGELAALKRAGVEIHARSAFLQGALLMDPATLPVQFDPARPLLARYREFLQERGFTPLQAALGFVCGLAELDAVICGFNNQDQLRQALSQLGALDPADFASFACSDERIVDPSRWRL